MQPEPSVSKPSKRRSTERDASGMNVGSSATIRPKEVVSREGGQFAGEGGGVVGEPTAVASVEEAAAVIGVGERTRWC